MDLTVSRIFSVKVPDLVGLGLETAKALIEKSRIRLEGVKEKPSDKNPGTVLAQSLNPGSEIEVNSAIVLTISTKIFKVPNLLGLELESAKQVIEKSGLQLGGVKEQLSGGKQELYLLRISNPDLKLKQTQRLTLLFQQEKRKWVLKNPCGLFPKLL